MTDPIGSRIAIPMGRPGHVGDISHCAVSLASGLSSYLTGNTLHPDGGTWASSGRLNWSEEGRPTTHRYEYCAARSRGGSVWIPKSVRRAWRAAYRPHIPCTPAPGEVADEHR